MEDITSALTETVGAFEDVLEEALAPTQQEQPVQEQEQPIQEQPTEEEPAPVKTKKPRKLTTTTRRKVKVKAQPKSIEEWIEARIKDPKRFTLTSEGNAFIPAIGSGNRELILDIHEYVPVKAEQIDSFYEARNLKVKEAKEHYAESRRALYNVYKQYKAGVASISDYLLANKQVVEAEEMLIASGVVARTIKPIVEPSPLARELYPEHKNSKKKLPETVYRLERTTLPWSALITQDIDTEEGSEQDKEKEQEQLPPPENQKTDEEKEKQRLGAIIATRRRIRA